MIARLDRDARRDTLTRAASLRPAVVMIDAPVVENPDARMHAAIRGNDFLRIRRIELLAAVDDELVLVHALVQAHADFPRVVTDVVERCRIRAPVVEVADHVDAGVLGCVDAEDDAATAAPREQLIGRRRSEGQRRDQRDAGEQRRKPECQGRFLGAGGARGIPPATGSGVAGPPGELSHCSCLRGHCLRGSVDPHPVVRRRRTSPRRLGNPAGSAFPPTV